MRSIVSFACALLLLSLPWCSNGQESSVVSPALASDTPADGTFVEDLNNTTPDDLEFNETGVTLDDLGGDNETMTFDTESPSATPQTPTELPSSPPSPAPLAPVVVPVVGQIPLKLINTQEVMKADTIAIFLSATLKFLKERLDSTTLEIEETILLRQFRQSPPGDRRHLQSDAPSSPLYVVLQVVGKSASIPGEEPLDLDGALVSVFETSPDDYVVTLRDEDEEAFFLNLLGVEITTAEEDITPFPTPQPTPNPTVGSILPQNPTSSPVARFNPAEIEDNPTSLGVIIGIAVAGVIIVVLLVLIARRLTKKKETGSASEKSAPLGASGAGSDNGWTRNPRPYQNNTNRGGSSSPLSTDDDQVASKSIPLQEQGSDMESQTVFSIPKNDSDMDGSTVYNQSIQNADTMSYAYSLEPGFEASVADSFSAHSRSVPNQISAAEAYPSNGTIVDGRLPNAESGIEANLRADSHIYGTASDMELTDTELAMLPSNLRGSSDASDRDAGTVTRKILAPPGKLGLVIDTTVEGPVVHRVNDSSALKGKLSPGNIIIGIDNVDTRAMSASAITNLMIQTANKNRILTVLETGRAHA